MQAAITLVKKIGAKVLECVAVVQIPDILQKTISKTSWALFFVLRGGVVANQEVTGGIGQALKMKHTLQGNRALFYDTESLALDSEDTVWIKRRNRENEFIHAHATVLSFLEKCQRIHFWNCQHNHPDWAIRLMHCDALARKAEKAEKVENKCSPDFHVAMGDKLVTDDPCFSSDTVGMIWHDQRHHKSASVKKCFFFTRANAQRSWSCILDDLFTELLNLLSFIAPEIILLKKFEEAVF